MNQEERFKEIQVKLKSLYQQKADYQNYISLQEVIIEEAEMEIQGCNEEIKSLNHTIALTEANYLELQTLEQRLNKQVDPKIATQFNLF